MQMEVGCVGGMPREAEVLNPPEDMTQLGFETLLVHSHSPLDLYLMPSRENRVGRTEGRHSRGKRLKRQELWISWLRQAMSMYKVLDRILDMDIW